MAQQKSNRHRDGESNPRPRKQTLSDKRKKVRDQGYQRLEDIIYRGGQNPPCR